MALATRCPDCKATFRVVSDQLRLRGGLVRCGNCRHVFDAIGSLSYIDEAVLSPSLGSALLPAAPQGGSATQAARAGGDTGSAAAPEAKGALTGQPHAPPSPPAAVPVAAAAPDAAEPPDRPTIADPLAVPTLLAARSSEQEDAAGAEPLAADGATATLPAAPAASGAQPARERRRSRRPPAAAATPAALADDEIGFLRPRPSRRGFSIVFGGGSLLLACAFAVQLAVAFRSELLMRWPELRPQLAAICAVYGCTVGWPTRAEALAVVGTELQAVPGTEILELTAVIRNRANFRVALPAVEVTLTDTANRMLARKVFAPVDYLASSGEPSRRIDDGIGPGSDHVVRITFEARGLSAAGFVVYPFYL